MKITYDPLCYGTSPLARKHFFRSRAHTSFVLRARKVMTPVVISLDLLRHGTVAHGPEWLVLVPAIRGKLRSPFSREGIGGSQQETGHITTMSCVVVFLSFRVEFSQHPCTLYRLKSDLSAKRKVGTCRPSHSVVFRRLGLHIWSGEQRSA